MDETNLGYLENKTASSFRFRVCSVSLVSSLDYVCSACLAELVH